MKIRTFAGMTPDKRLNQLEPVVADTAQKVDRLIETNAQILDLAIRGNATAELAVQKADIAADKADQAAQKADLAYQMANLAAQKADLAANKADQAAQKADLAAQKADLAAKNAEIAARGVAALTVDLNNFKLEVRENFKHIERKIDTELGSFRQEMNQRFDQLVTLIQNRL